MAYNLGKFWSSCPYFIYCRNNIFCRLLDCRGAAIPIKAHYSWLHQVPCWPDNVPSFRRPTPGEHGEGWHLPDIIEWPVTEIDHQLHIWETHLLCVCRRTTFSHWTSLQVSTLNMCVCLHLSWHHRRFWMSNMTVAYSVVWDGMQHHIHISLS